MENVLYDPLPEEWNGYQVNTWFQVGIQVYKVFDDDDLAGFEKDGIIKYLLFGDEDGKFRDHPEGEDLSACINWFLNGWSHDNPSGRVNKQKVMDFYNDQWRIYADFRQIYGINLNESDLHWWEFCGLLWNMPQKQSSFLQVVDMRRKEIRKNMSKEEKAFIKEAKAVYALKQPKTEKKYTPEESEKIDDFDRMMKERRRK